MWASLPTKPKYYKPSMCLVGNGLDHSVAPIIKNRNTLIYVDKGIFYMY